MERLPKVAGIPEDELDNTSQIVDPEGRRGGPEFTFKSSIRQNWERRVRIDINASDGLSVTLAKRKEQVNSEVSRLLSLEGHRQQELEEMESTASSCKIPKEMNFAPSRHESALMSTLKDPPVPRTRALSCNSNGRYNNSNLSIDELQLFNENIGVPPMGRILTDSIQNRSRYTDRTRNDP